MGTSWGQRYSASGISEARYPGKMWAPPVLAFDPGGTTGACLLSATPDRQRLWWYAWEFAYEQAEMDLDQLWCNLEANIVVMAKRHAGQHTWEHNLDDLTFRMVIESFVLRGHKVDPVALEVIGLLKRTAAKHGFEIIWQQPSQIQGSGAVLDPAGQRTLGAWMPGHEHANDAFRHALLWRSSENGGGEVSWRTLAAGI
jgi:hypothetical protein